MGLCLFSPLSLEFSAWLRVSREQLLLLPGDVDLMMMMMIRAISMSNYSKYSISELPSLSGQENCFQLFRDLFQLGVNRYSNDYLAREVARSYSHSRLRPVELLENVCTLIASGTDES